MFCSIEQKKKILSCKGNQTLNQREVKSVSLDIVQNAAGYDPEQPTTFWTLL